MVLPKEEENRIKDAILQLVHEFTSNGVPIDVNTVTSVIYDRHKELTGFIDQDVAQLVQGVLMNVQQQHMNNGATTQGNGKRSLEVSIDQDEQQEAKKSRKDDDGQHNSTSSSNIYQTASSSSSSSSSSSIAPISGDAAAATKTAAIPAAAAAATTTTKTAAIPPAPLNPVADGDVGEVEAAEAEEEDDDDEDYVQEQEQELDDDMVEPVAPKNKGGGKRKGGKEKVKSKKDKLGGTADPIRTLSKLLSPEIYGVYDTKEPRDDRAKFCKCKNSKCLKLYCECYACGIYCSPKCICENCENNVAHEENRSAAIRATLMRNPQAFRSKIKKPKKTASGGHLLGCNCRKSRCLKKYCECFQNAVFCTIKCNCHDCENTPESKRRKSVMHRLSNNRKDKSDAPSSPSARSTASKASQKKGDKKDKSDSPYVHGLADHPNPLELFALDRPVGSHGPAVQRTIKPFREPSTDGFRSLQIIRSFDYVKPTHLPVPEVEPGLGETIPNTLLDEKMKQFISGGLKLLTQKSPPQQPSSTAATGTTSPSSSQVENLLDQFLKCVDELKPK